VKIDYRIIYIVCHDFMKTYLIILLFGTMIFVSGCGSSSDEVLYSEEDVLTGNVLDESERPTMSTELPVITNEEIITQQDTSL
jgi:hypothetical protein